MTNSDGLLEKLCLPTGCKNMGAAERTSISILWWRCNQLRTKSESAKPLAPEGLRTLKPEDKTSMSAVWKTKHDYILPPNSTLVEDNLATIRNMLVTADGPQLDHIDLAKFKTQAMYKTDKQQEVQRDPTTGAVLVHDIYHEQVANQFQFFTRIVAIIRGFAYVSAANPDFLDLTNAESLIDTICTCMSDPEAASLPNPTVFWKEAWGKTWRDFVMAEIFCKMFFSCIRSKDFLGGTFWPSSRS